jgi:nitroreductase
MGALDPLLSRHSTPSKLLGEPGPDKAQVMAMLRAAVQVPDHGKLVPWRFIRIAGESRIRLGERAAALAASRGADEMAVDKERKRFSFAPVVIAVVAKVTPGHKIPEQEQLLSAGCVAFNLLHAAHLLGFGAQMLTGWLAYDPVVYRWFELGDDERIAAFVHIGTAKEPVPDRPRPDPARLLTDLSL